MKRRFLSFSLVAFVVLIPPARTAEEVPPESKPSLRWDKIPGAEHHPRIREARWRFRLTASTREEIERTLQSIVTSEVSSESSADFLVVTEILARKTGAPALNFAQAHRARDVTDRSIRDAFVRGWAKADVEAAAAWLESTSASGWEEDEKTELARIILQTHARHDPSGAMQRALRYGDADPSRREAFASAVIEELVYHGRFETARELARKLAEPHMRRAIEADLIGLVAEYRPELAATWFHELPSGEGRPGMIFRLMEAWTTRSLREAVTFYETLEPPERTIDLVESTLINSNDPRPEVVEKLAAGFSAGPEMDRLLIAALNRINTVFPSEIPWPWFERFTDSRSRDRLLVSLLAQHYRRDPTSAKSIVERLTFLRAEERHALLNNLARSATPERARNSPSP